MSRVDDDRDAARIAERLAQAKRAEESKSKDKSAAASAFSKLVQTQKGAAQQLAGQKAAAQAQESTTRAHDAIAQLLGQSETRQADGDQQTHAQAQTRQGTKTFEDRVRQGASSEGNAAARAKQASDQGQTQTAAGRSADQSGASLRSDSRGQDSRASNARLEDRKESSDTSREAAKGGSAAGGAHAEKGDLKADADKGGSSQQGGKEGKGEQAAVASFRFNPALMAPVTVQKKNETQSSDRLRKAASEIAQKIVERVRVGTNAMGKLEFQIDLKNDVLGGMSVKVSAKNGKISAVFSGSDKDVLKMLEEQSESLKTALGSRGLTLESLKTEAKV
jgi:hypothetical protein